MHFIIVLFLGFLCCALRALLSFFKNSMSSIPTPTALQSWTVKRLREFLEIRKVDFTGMRKKKDFINKVLEVQLKEHLVDSTVTNSSNTHVVNDSNNDEQITISRSQLKEMIQQAIQQQQLERHADTIQENNVQVPEQEPESTIHRSKIEEFLLNQVEQAKNDDARSVAGIKRDLREGSCYTFAAFAFGVLCGLLCGLKERV